MRALTTTVILVTLACSPGPQAQPPVPPAPQAPIAPGTPAQKRIAWAEAAIAKNAHSTQAYNDLAAALVDRARETSDPAYVDKAAAALGRVLGPAPDDFSGNKTQVEILLSRRQFKEALGLARSLNDRLPDDIAVYSLIAEAAFEIGAYDESVKAAQFMFDLRPPTASGYARAAALREVFGDLDGAADFLDAAYRLSHAGEPAARAAILSQRGALELRRGHVDAADGALQLAREIFPDHLPALAIQADVRSAQGLHAEAVALLRDLSRRRPHARITYARAQALERAGLRADAASAFADFEREATARAGHPDNANRELILYYAGNGRKPAESVRIARLEVGRRQDVRTLDAYAAALHAHGLHAEARAQIRKALAVGTREPVLLWRAGVIARALNNRREAARYFAASLAANPSSASAPSARAALRSLGVATTSAGPGRRSGR